MRDPREDPVLPTRDLAGLAFIGRGYEVGQYHLREAVFPGKSEVVASRRVRRWASLNLIRIHRWMGMGMNLLRLTPAGRDLVVASGIAPEEELFTPSKSVALKDARHLLFVNDVRTLALQGVPIAADVVAPAWLLQRRIQPPPPSIPDLLLTVNPKHGRRGRLIAVEIDLGGERLAATFLPKLKLQDQVLRGWAGDAKAAVIILTRGPRRRLALQEGISNLGLTVPVLVEELPPGTGLEGLDRLREVLSRPASTSEHRESV